MRDEELKLTKQKEAHYRFECLKLVCDYNIANYTKPEYEPVIEAATAFYDFIKGTNDLEVIKAAREFAEKVKR